jgi:hypothetical protein
MTQVPGTFFRAIRDLKRLFVKATLVSNDPGARHFFQPIQDPKRLFVKAASGLKTALTSAWHLTENRFALLALLYYNSRAKNLVAFLKPEATARAGVSPRRPGCSDYARQL